MKVIGIIAEYNPFHNGHAYQIRKIRKEMQADFVVAAMSGDFVQRGAPAVIDKYARTKMALSCGADLVIELPVLWATASAESFAMAGVTLLDKMGCVDGICFGAETDDFNLLSMLADVLAEEPEAYRNELSSYLKHGFAFPVARSKALCGYLAQAGFLTGGFDLETVSSILNEPNNILAIEYLKALKRSNSSVTPYVIKREGAGYHETEMLSQTSYGILGQHIAESPLPLASATAIRKELERISQARDCRPADEPAAVMPAPAWKVLNEYMETSALIQANDFSSILGYRLLTAGVDTLAAIADSNPDLANRIYKNRMQFSSFEQFCEWNKRKDVTYTRISRVLLHLILNITAQDYRNGKDSDYIPYLRMLGFRQDSSALLKELKTAAQIPVISKLADAAALLDSKAMTVLEKDIFAANLYEQICAVKKGTTSRNEYLREIVRI